MVHADGSVRWVYERGRGIFTASGEVEFLDGAIFDITARKEAEDRTETVRDTVRKTEVEVENTAGTARPVSPTETTTTTTETPRTSR